MEHSREAGLAATLSLTIVCFLLCRRRTISRTVPVVVSFSLDVCVGVPRSITRRLTGEMGPQRSRVPLMRCLGHHRRRRR